MVSQRWSMTDGLIHSLMYMRVAAFVDGVNHMCFPTFSMHIMFFAEHGKNAALLLFQAGGINNGITYNDFMNKWSR